MEQEFLTKTQFAALYPEQWVLLGNPTFEKTKVTGGIVLYHSKDKKEVCYLGKAQTKGYDKITVTYTGELRNMRRLGIMKRMV
jgi:hypothetical protein